MHFINFVILRVEFSLKSLRLKAKHDTKWLHEGWKSGHVSLCERSAELSVTTEAQQSSSSALPGISRVPLDSQCHFCYLHDAGRIPH